MFEHTSRYHNIETKSLETSSGRSITYVGRRFLPSGETLPTLLEMTVVDGDRLDLITARSLGDPEQFWRVCDANDAMNPFDLTAESGVRIRVPVPQA